MQPRPVPKWQNTSASAIEIEILARQTVVAWFKENRNIDPDRAGWKTSIGVAELGLQTIAKRMAQGRMVEKSLDTVTLSDQLFWGQIPANDIEREFNFRLDRERRRLETLVVRKRGASISSDRAGRQMADLLAELSILKKQIYERFARVNKNRLSLDNPGRGQKHFGDFTFELGQAKDDYVSLVRVVSAERPEEILQLNYAPDAQSSGPVATHLQDSDFISFRFPTLLKFVFQTANIQNVGYGELVHLIDWLERIVSRRTANPKTLRHIKEELDEFSSVVFDQWFYKMFAPRQMSHRKLVELEFRGDDLLRLYALSAIRTQPDFLERRDLRAARLKRPDLSADENSDSNSSPPLLASRARNRLRKSSARGALFTPEFARTPMSRQQLSATTREDQGDDPLLLKFDRWLFDPGFVFLTEDGDPAQPIAATEAGEIDPVRDVRVRMIQAQEISPDSKLQIFTPPECELKHIQIVDAQNQSIWRAYTERNDDRDPGYTIWRSARDGGYVVKFKNLRRRSKIRYVADFRRIENTAPGPALDAADLARVRERVSSARLNPLNAALGLDARQDRPLPIRDFVEKFGQLSSYARSVGTTPLPEGDSLIDFDALVTRDQVFFGNCVAANRFANAILKDSLAKHDYDSEVRLVIAFQNGSYRLGRDVHAAYLVHRGPSEIFWLDATPQRDGLDEVLLPRDHTAAELRRRGKRRAGTASEDADPQTEADRGRLSLETPPTSITAKRLESWRAHMAQFAQHREDILEEASRSGLASIQDHPHPLWEALWISGAVLKLFRGDSSVTEFRERIFKRFDPDRSGENSSSMALLELLREQVDKIINLTQAMEAWPPTVGYDPNLLPVARSLAIDLNRILHDSEAHRWEEIEGLSGCEHALTTL